ncbi:MAG: PQQ-binding-like beta-propeller repeat protein [Pirellulaceae bacterium]
MSARMVCLRIGVALVASSLAHAIAVRAEDWPRWRGVRGDGTWQAPAIPEKWPDEGPPLVWKQPLGPGYSGISVAGGRVYTMDRPPESDDERIVCFDEKSGEPVWQHRYRATYKDLDYGKGPRCTPTVHDGRVYTLGAVGHLHCLDASTGRMLWAKDLVEDHKAKQPMWGFAASPVIDGDRVIIHAGLPGGCYSAYDRLSGKEAWRGGDDPAGYGTPILIEHAGLRQLVGWTPEHIVAHRLDTGELLWKYPYKITYGVSIATPIFHEGIVLVCGYWHGSRAIELGDRPDKAELLWEENRFLRGIMDQPLYRAGHVYLLDKQHGIVAFELAKGEKLWTDGNRLTPRDRNPQVSMVWLGDSDRAICLNAQGELVLVRLTPQGLVEQSRAKIVGENWAHPAYAGNCCFARDDEQIVCVRLSAD